jgi:microsomal dipeptidase-like Zn-dependent dipeptidase
VGIVAALALAGGPAAGLGATGRAPSSRFALANRCFAAASAVSQRFLTTAGSSGYRASARRVRGAAPLFFKPTGLGTYMIQDRSGSLLSVGAGAAVVPTATPDVQAAWSLIPSGRQAFGLRSIANGRWLAAEPGGVVDTTADRGSRTRLRFQPAHRCQQYPEAGVNAVGPAPRAVNRDGTVFGYADPHMHITADYRAGGDVVAGESFDPFGVTVALGVQHDEQVLGPNETLDITGDLLRGDTLGSAHDPHGWPTFVGWPTSGTYTHQQIYYRWLQRAWLGGLRLVNAQLVEDQSLCAIEPRTSHSCDETATIELELEHLRALQAYVDAQSGGPGHGWFRLVTDPWQARRVIEQGKLAVLVGAETSDLFDCPERLNQPQCTQADVDRGIALYKRLGISSVFIAHWLNNSFAGAALMGGAEGQFISAMEVQTTGLPFQTGPCPEAGQGSSCNSMGLTPLGAYLIQKLMDNHMLIEMDHLSEQARLDVLKLVEARNYPIVSSHTNTGGFWTPSDLQRLYKLGGFATARPAQAPALAQDINSFRPYLRQRSGQQLGVGLGTDTGGLNASPGPDPSATQAPLHYPFKPYGSSQLFYCEITGTHTFNLNVQGVADYGQYPDLLAYMRQQPGGQAATKLLYHSAEGYLQMWERAMRQ